MLLLCWADAHRDSTAAAGERATVACCRYDGATWSYGEVTAVGTGIAGRSVSQAGRLRRAMATRTRRHRHGRQLGDSCPTSRNGQGAHRHTRPAYGPIGPVLPIDVSMSTPPSSTFLSHEHFREAQRRLARRGRGGGRQGSHERGVNRLLRRARPGDVPGVPGWSEPAGAGTVAAACPRSCLVITIPLTSAATRPPRGEASRARCGIRPPYRLPARPAQRLVGGRNR
jgi:hypothetical protein